MVTDNPELKPLFDRIEALAPYLDDGAVVLTPNRRLSRAILSADARRRVAAGAKAWHTPIVVPERQFWTDVWRAGVLSGDFSARAVLDVPAQRLLWRRVIVRDSQDHFSLLSPGRAATLCQAAHENLLLWQIDPDHPRWQSWFTTDDDAQVFLRWREAFHAELQRLEACTPAQAHTEMLVALERGSTSAIPLMVRLLCDDTPPLHRALAEKSGQSVEIDLPEHRGRPDAYRAYADADSELQAAARWCLDAFERDPSGRYGVVLQDMQEQRAVFETHLRREFGCLTTNYASLPVNFATGFTLAQVPIVRDALRALGCAAQEVDIEDCLALLTSRFVAPLGLAAQAFERSAASLRDLATERIPASLLREALADVTNSQDLEAPWNAPLRLESEGVRLRKRRQPSAWTQIYRTLLDAWRWGTGVALDSIEYQQHAAWHEALDIFASLDGILPDLGYEDSLNELRQLLNDRPFQPQTADRAIQVLGPLETTGLDFDGLWLTGMDARAWPARARPNPYLPTGLQRAVRMPSADASLTRAEATRRAEHWQSCTAELVISYLRQRDDTEQLPSPVFAELPVQEIDEVAEPDPRWSHQAGAAWESVILREPILQAGERAFEGIGSAVLDAQVSCPFQAFAKARLDTAPRPGPHIGLLPSERGNILHRALHRLFSDIPNRDVLVGASPAALDFFIENAVKEGRKALWPRRRLIVGPEALTLEEQRLGAVLREWLALELTRPGAFTVVEREVERKLHLGTLIMNLRIDRIDHLESGEQLIIDYKTGRPEPLGKWFSEPPERTQMPLYALAEERADGFVHAVVRPGESQWRGVASRPVMDGVEALPDADAQAEDATPDGDAAFDPTKALRFQRARWRADLENLAQEFQDGASQVEPLQGACRYCQRHRLCRIGEVSA